jgi:uncharacterized protein YjbI with pentapeptide repeats
MSGAKMDETTREDTTLSGVDLHGADLGQSLLDGADLSDANLAQAILDPAVLRGTNLASAVHLDRASLAYARYDRHTRWPAGFDPGAIQKWAPSPPAPLPKAGRGVA